MPGRLEGKVAIVTGAGSAKPEIGVGRAISILFARERAKVVLVNRVAEHAKETLSAIRDEGGEASICAGDVSRAQDCRRMAQEAVDAYGKLDILVNNVGIVSEASVVDVTEDEWDRVLDVNLKGMMLTSKYAIPRMREGGGGAIINMSSVGAWRTNSEIGAAYHASKGAVVSLTKSMAVRHGRDGIRVNCIAPGPIHSGYLGQMSEQVREARRSATPLSREGTPWDVAFAALFLASDEARWITGVALPVDGGILAVYVLDPAFGRRS